MIKEGRVGLGEYGLFNLRRDIGILHWFGEFVVGGSYHHLLSFCWSVN
jgi:hypothetical protein